jgi:ABC-2 type transport system ATP-binding protein
MIEAIDLVKSYGSVRALSGVSFSVGPGEILGYLGPNGAGKSTTVKILTGLQRADAGIARIGGHDIAQEPLAAKRLIGLVPETGALYEALTPIEYLRFVGQLYELGPHEAEKRARELLEFLELERNAWDRRMGGFSKGMKQRVVLAAAVLHRPQVILFDEPLNGLDVAATIKVKELIATEAAAGRTILYCSHLLDIVERICTRIIILAAGQVRLDGSLAEFQARHPGRTLEWMFQEYTGMRAVRSDEARPAAVDSR